MQKSPDSSPSVAAIIVTHNSAAVVGKAVAALMLQTLPPDRIVLVDCGSADRAYLQALADRYKNVTVEYAENIGFAAGNNLGIRIAGTVDAYLLVNPDAFLAPDWLEKALPALAATSTNHGITPLGILSSPLRGYDLAQDQPSGRYDTTGLYQTWYGRWLDRHQRALCQDVTLPAAPFAPPAICGALMLVTAAAIQSLLAKDGHVFDERLFMYKEDVDLCLRLRKSGFRLEIDPALEAYHCRGWQPDRKTMPLWTRRMSARNDVRVGWKMRSVYLPFYLAKYVYVRWCER